MDKISFENKEARIHPKQWESVLKSKEWTDDELDTILALLVVEIGYMADFISDYEPMWTSGDIVNLRRHTPQIPARLHEEL